MADLYVKKFDMINPFVVASSPATQGALNVLKSAKTVSYTHLTLPTTSRV